MKRSFPVRIRQVTDLIEVENYENPIRYFVKAQSDGDETRVSVHFSLRQADGSPRVGSFLTVTVEDEDRNTDRYP